MQKADGKFAEDAGYCTMSVKLGSDGTYLEKEKKIITSEI